MSEDHDVDAILQQAYSGESSIPMESTSPHVQETAPVQQAPKEWEFDWKGQRIKADETKLVKWAQQGYDYAQNVNSFKGEKEKWDKERQEWDSKVTPYRQIDEFAVQNPDWWSHVEQSYQQKMQNRPEIPAELKNYLEPIVQDYSLVKTFVQDYQKQQVEKEFQEQDAKLDRDIKSISEKYGNLDFSSKDESGQSLEQRVLDHALQNNIPTFRASFLDYYHDQLETLAETRGRESVSKEMKERKKLGILEESKSPFKSFLSPSQNVGKKSWGDLHAEVLKELNIS